VPDPRLQRTSRELFFAVLTGGAANLETWVIDRMTSVVEEEDVPAGKRLFAEGEPPESIFFIRDGRLRLERDGATPWVFEGRTAIGVFDALLDRPHARTAIAETDLHLLKLRVDNWLELLEDSFGLARAALRNSVITVAGLEARRWATQDAPHGTVVARVPPVLGTLAFVERLAVLADVTMIRGAGIQVLVELADMMEEVTFEPGATIFERGNRRGEALLVLQGEAEGNRLDPALRVVFGPGSVVGGVASLGEPMLAWEARATTRVRALSMKLEDYFDLMEEHFDLVRSALSGMALEREAILDDLSTGQGELRVG
jgi:CRP-like cAMP-binding protein